MASNERPVFVVATANDIEKLPPELIRKGRLDDICGSAHRDGSPGNSEDPSQEASPIGR